MHIHAGKPALPPLFIVAAFLLITTRVTAQAEPDTSVPAEGIKEPPPEIEAVTDSVTTDFSETKQVFRYRREGDSFLMTEPRKLPEEQVRKMKGDKAFWYADYIFKKKKEPENRGSYTPLSERTWFQTFIWILILGGFAGALIWYLAGSQVGLFRKPAKSTESGEESGELPEDIFSIRYQREIDRAVSQGNYRLAVRLLYLRLLTTLSEKNIIRYKQDRTNFEYLLQLRPTNYYDRFFRLTRHYEYSWYGHFEVPEMNYRVIRGEFEEMEKEIGGRG